MTNGVRQHKDLHQRIRVPGFQSLRPRTSQTRPTARTANLKLRSAARKAPKGISRAIENRTKYGLRGCRDGEGPRKIPDSAPHTAPRPAKASSPPIHP